MNIGLISEVYGGITTPPDGYGGIAFGVHDVSEELISRGHNVRLFAIEGSRTAGELVVVPAGDAQYDLYPDTIPPYVKEAKKHIVWADVWMDGSHHKRFARWCLENRPEVPVICPSWNPNWVDLPQNPFFQSPHMYEAVTGVKGGEHVPWFWWGLPLGSYVPLYQPTRDPVCINVIAEHKGTDLLVAAAAKHGFPVELYGHMDTVFFRRRVRQHMRHDNIKYMGEIGRQRIQFLRESVMSFTLSIWPEPGSRVTMESLALGCPCVVTASGCLRHYITDGFNGAIVGRDPDSIYAGYRKVLEGGQIMRRDARRSAGRFDMQATVSNIEELFKRVMDGERWMI